MEIMVEAVLPNGETTIGVLDDSRSMEEILRDLIDALHLDPSKRYEVGIMLGSDFRLSETVRIEEGARLVVRESGKLVAVVRHKPVTQIYHLSDLHFPHERIADQKVLFGPAYDSQIGNQPYEVFEQFLQREFDQGSDMTRFFIISGDLAGHATYEELEEAVEFIVETTSTFQPPIPDERVVVVPGNHDVNWKIASSSKMLSEKFDTFKSRFHDADRKFLLPAFKRTAGKPYRFFPDQGVLIYALNSCLLGGIVREDISEAQLATNDFEAIGKMLIGQYEGDPAIVEAFQRTLKRLRKIDDTSSIIDAGLVGKDFIQRIPQDLSRLRKELKDSRTRQIFDNSLRIAVLHHHVSPFSPVETKEFEELLDAGALKATLVAQGFHIVLHGHKHQPRVTRESLIDKGGEHSLVVIAAGSLGDWRSGSSFNVITLSDPMANEVEVQINAVRMSRDGTRFENDPLAPFVIRKAVRSAFSVQGAA